MKLINTVICIHQIFKVLVHKASLTSPPFIEVHMCQARKVGVICICVLCSVLHYFNMHKSVGTVEI